MYNFIQRIKEECLLVKLDTNGRDPEIVEQLINNKLVDYVAMDIKNPLHQMHILTGVTEDTEPYRHTINILLKGKVDYEFRTTVIKRYHTPQSIATMAQSIQ